MTKLVTSVSPASITAPPMTQTRSGSASAMTSLRRPDSAVAPVGFTQLPGAGVFVTASPDGSIWVLSTQGGAQDKFIYHYQNGTWTNIPGAASRLAVGPDNTLWAINSSGGIYSYKNGAWSTIAGGASDIAVGADGSVYVVSSLPGGVYGNGIWHYVNGTWTQLPGAATRIATSWDTGSYQYNVSAGGFYVVNALLSIYYYNPQSGFTQIPGAAVQVAPTINGGIFALGVPSSSIGNPIYYNNLVTGSWTQQAGAAVSIATNSSYLYVISAAGGIYQAPVTSTSRVYVANSGASSVTVYAASPVGSLNEAPLATIAGSNTGLSAPNSVAVDAAGKIYVENSGTFSVTVYAANPSGTLNESPLATIAGNNTGISYPDGIAVDASGRIYVANYFGQSVTVYAANPTGTLNESPLATIAGSNTGLFWPGGVAVDATGKIYVTNGQGDFAINVYPANPVGTLNESPVATISGSNTGLNIEADHSGDITVDSSGRIYTANYAQQSITVFAANPSGLVNEAPLATIAGPLTGLSGNAVAVDADGKIYATNTTSVACCVTVYAANPIGTLNEAPIGTLTGNATGLSYANGIAIH